MESNTMTALVSAYARAYHCRNNTVTVFDDCVAGLLLSDEEYLQISQSMADGIGFFHPSFNGSRQDALKWVVDTQLSPSPLGRAAFAESSLETAVRIGARQYLLLGAGYDSFAYRQADFSSQLQIFEIDRPAMILDKQKRIQRAGLTVPDTVHYIEADVTDATWSSVLLQNAAFDPGKISFCSMLGLVYYLSKPAFSAMLSAFNSLFPEGSSLVFDYPDETSGTNQSGVRAQKQHQMAAAANENMIAGYSYMEMEQLLEKHGFLIFEHLAPQEITERFFRTYNEANPTAPMTAMENVRYCLAVKNPLSSVGVGSV